MPAVEVSADVRLRDDRSLVRRVTVTPGMCGGSRFFGQIGDWTWEAVAAASQTNVYAARNAEGQPSYLSFYYYRVRSSALLSLDRLTFGDELEVTSRVLGIGGQSVLTLHRISHPDAAFGDPLELDECYENPRPDCVYVENVNRWISRTRRDSNQALVEAAPVGFRADRLPQVPPARSPRAATRHAREHRTFHVDGVTGYTMYEPVFRTTYELDAVRDLNGVELVYFATYFSIVDTALLRIWRRIGRGTREFLHRRVLDHRLGFFGNADLDSAFGVEVRLWRSDTVPGDEIADITINDGQTGRLIAVVSVHLRTEQR